jgi:hypothetical protein
MARRRPLVRHRGAVVCRACGKRGADVRPDFNLDKKPAGMMGYRS